jgi:hypothetical protein
MFQPMLGIKSWLYYQRFEIRHKKLIIPEDGEGKLYIVFIDKEL